MSPDSSSSPDDARIDPAAHRPGVVLRLPDGGDVLARPVHPDDRPLLVDGFNRLSPRTRYLRFLAPSERLTGSQLAYLVEVDHRDHVAWGILDGGTAVAVGRWVRLDQPGTADVAVTVTDEHQGRGIGRIVLQVLGATARARGVGQFHFDVLAENAPMIGLLASMGATRADDGEVSHHVMDVATIPAPPTIDGDLLALAADAADRAG